MFAYIDETGNTGLNLFDKDQSFFYASSRHMQKKY